MRKIKLVSAILSLALLSSLFTACGQNGPETNIDDPVVPENNETVVPEDNGEEDQGDEIVSLIDYNDATWYDDSLIINNDPNWYGGVSSDSAEAAIDSAKALAQKYVGKGFSDVLFCVFEQTSIIPSEYQMWRASKYNMTEENGIPVDYSSFEGFYNVYTEYKVDPFEIILDTLRENGIRPWVTLRMNDVHFGVDETSFLKSDFFYEAKEKGYMIGSNGQDYGYFNTALDYAVPEVREKMLKYIEEILGKYDMFGLELDFMREIFCFDYINNPDCCSIMNDFIREVNKLIVSAEQKWEHDIKLMIRVPRSIEASTVYGFDVTTWVNEDLVDALVPSPRWEVADSGIPVTEWVELVGDKNIAVFPTPEVLNLKYTVTTTEIAAAYAASWYSQGADGFYGYNYYPYPDMIQNFSREYCENMERKFVVTYQDIYPEGTEQYKPLPVSLKSINESKAPLEFNIGKVDAADTVILTVSVLGNPEKIDISKATINGVSAVSFENMGSGYVKAPAEDRSGDVVLSNGIGFVFTYTGIETDGDVSLFFESDKLGVIDYIDFRIIPNK